MQVVGITRGTSKEKKKDYTVLHLVGDFEEYQKENSEGNTAQNVYIPKKIDVSIGDDIELIYGVGYQGKAVVTDVKAFVN